MTTTALPPLDGSSLFDPWRRRLRQKMGLPADAEPPRQPTRSELMLWDRLANRKPAWAAEHPTVHGYCLDFYCDEARLAIEVDGPSHWGQRKAHADAWRDSVHDRLGIRTRRFSARHVEEDVDSVVREIDQLVAERLATDTAAVEVPELVAAEVAADERLQLYPPDPPGWSATLPTCETVLPQLSRRGLRDLLRH